MSVLRFVDDLVGHLAWPLVAIFALVFFRQVLNEKVNEITDADVSMGKMRVIVGFRRQLKSDLGYAGVDLSQAAEGLAETSVEPESSSQTSVGSTETFPIPVETERRGRVFNSSFESSDGIVQWDNIRKQLARNPHSAVHLAGLRIDSALNELADVDAPGLGSLVKPRFLAEQGKIPQELSDASFRLLRARNLVEGSPKFLLSQGVAEDFVNKAEELVSELRRLIN